MPVIRHLPRGKTSTSAPATPRNGCCVVFFPRKLNRNHMQIQIEFSINPKSASPGELSSCAIIFGYRTLSLSLSLFGSFSHHVDVFKYASFAVCCNLIGLAFGRLPAPIPFPIPFTVPNSLSHSANEATNLCRDITEKGWRVLTSACVARATFLRSCFINYYSN